MVSVTVSTEDIGIGAEFLFSETKTPFFFKFYSLFPASWRSTNFYKLENKSSPSKIIQKYVMFGRKFGFRSLFMMEKIPHAIGN